MEPANILRIESLDTGWCDKDQVMLHACFQLLKDCIEQENLLNGDTDWEQSQMYRDAKTELMELYEWWKKRSANDNSPDPITPQQFEEDNSMLIRLIKVRWTLWT